ncbi:hypothetical protein CCACVL1_20187 [Corchorus capsularis]|uniref:Uncharacterized protein n=1 Tax=Corchorus capsularis TaxID=210143 RepID=A0A1R3HC36_COCAP|nr:hypothetical protein CCACVL1_20187 [Corchorus capsularis]
MDDPRPLATAACNNAADFIFHDKFYSERVSRV